MTCLRVFAALVAAAAGGEGGRKRGQRGEQHERAETAQGIGLLVIESRIGWTRDSTAVAARSGRRLAAQRGEGVVGKFFQQGAHPSPLKSSIGLMPSFRKTTVTGLAAAGALISGPSLTSPRESSTSFRLPEATVPRCRRQFAGDPTDDVVVADVDLDVCLLHRAAHCPARFFDSSGCHPRRSQLGRRRTDSSVEVDERVDRRGTRNRRSPRTGSSSASVPSTSAPPSSLRLCRQGR